jgi:hypothetical protein
MTFGHTDYFQVAVRDIVEQPLADEVKLYQGELASRTFLTKADWTSTTVRRAMK